MDGDGCADISWIDLHDVRCCVARVGRYSVEATCAGCMCYSTCHGLAYPHVGVEPGNGRHACLWLDDGVCVLAHTTRLGMVGHCIVLCSSRQGVGASRIANRPCC